MLLLDSAGICGHERNHAVVSGSTNALTHGQRRYTRAIGEETFREGLAPACYDRIALTCRGRFEDARHLEARRGASGRGAEAHLARTGDADAGGAPTAKRGRDALIEAGNEIYFCV